MLLDPLIALFCTQFSIMTPGSSPGPCQAAINAGSSVTQTTQTLNALESFMTQNTYKLVGKENVYGIAAGVYLINSYNQKAISAQIPLRPFELNTNLSYNNQSYGIKWGINW